MMFLTKTNGQVLASKGENMRQAACILVLGLAVIGLTGCGGNLTVIQNGLDASGNPVATTINPMGAEVDASKEVLMTYKGGNGFGSATAQVTMRGSTTPITVDVFPSTKAVITGKETKCLTCESVLLISDVAAAAIGGTVATMVSENHREDSFDIALKLGDGVDTFILTVIGNNKRNAFTDFYGPGHYGTQPTPPPTNQYHLATLVSPANAGGITVNPNQDSYAAGIVVYLEAVANDGFVFDHWTVNDTESAWTSADAQVTMNSNVTVTAVFTSTKCDLKVTISPAGAGSVTVDPDQTEYDKGSIVKLQATANANYIFDHWTVNDTPGITDTNAQVTMNSDVVNVTAVFKANPPVEKIPPTITLNPVSQEVGLGDKVTFTVAATGSPTLVYQWYKGEAIIDQANATSYTIAAVAATDVGDYKCKVSNDVGDASSNVATLSLKTPPNNTGKLVVNLTTATNGSVSFSATAPDGYTPATFYGVGNASQIQSCGLQIYYMAAVNGLWTARQTFAPNGSAIWPITGILTDISGKTLRFEVVANADVTAGFGDPLKMIVKLNGTLVPRVTNSDGNTAYQVDLP